jgi:uncharacterized membrane protein YbhN (UPF0104 family)
MSDARRIIRRAAGPAFVLLAVALAAIAIWRDRHSIGDGFGRLPIASVIAALVFGCGAVVATMPIWRSMLHGLEIDLPLRPSARVFFLAQLGKYMPGSVWPVVAQMELARKHGVQRKKMLAAGVLTVVVNVVVGGILAVALLPFVTTEAFRRFWWLPLCLPVLVVLLHPKVIMATTNKLLRLAKREPLDVRLSGRAELRAAAWGVVSWMLLGAHIYALVAGLGATGARAMAASVAAGCLAISAGVLFLPAPAGAGIREVAFVVTLGPLLGSSEALLVALMSRVVLIVVDFGLAAAAARLKPAELPAETRPFNPKEVSAT